jgi:ABC-type histidine transport system ATPase subunit
MSENAIVVEQLRKRFGEVIALDGIDLERHDLTLRITSSSGARVLIDALRSLDGVELEPDSLTVREPSIDDVFLALTGHRAERPSGAPTSNEG